VAGTLPSNANAGGPRHNGEVTVGVDLGGTKIQAVVVVRPYRRRPVPVRDAKDRRR